MSQARRQSAGFARYAAPVAFLLAVTIAVLLIRAGLRGGGATTTAHRPETQASTRTVSHSGTTKQAQSRRFYTVVSGDTFGAISAKTGVPVSRLERLNPGVSSNALHVGQKLRVK